jgi:hypothetical protein
MIRNKKMLDKKKPNLGESWAIKQKIVENQAKSL